MAVTSEATTVWKGTLFEGSGNVALDSSGLADFPVNWKARAEGVAEHDQPRGAARRGALRRASRWRSRSHSRRPATPAESIQTTAAVTFEAGKGVLGSHLLVSARVPGITEEEFEAFADDAKDNCPISKALPASRSRSKPNSPDPCGCSSPAHPDSSAPSWSPPDRRRARGRATRAASRAGADEVSWSPASGIIDFTVMERVDAVVNLSGASLARLPWTSATATRSSTRASPRPARSPTRCARRGKAAAGVPQRARPSATTATARANCSPSTRAPARVPRGRRRAVGGRSAARPRADPHRHPAHRNRDRHAHAHGHGGALKPRGHAHQARRLGPTRHRRAALAVDRPRRRGRAPSCTCSIRTSPVRSTSPVPRRPPPTGS